MRGVVGNLQGLEREWGCSDLTLYDVFSCGWPFLWPGSFLFLRDVFAGSLCALVRFSLLFMVSAELGNMTWPRIVQQDPSETGRASADMGAIPVTLKCVVAVICHT